MCCVCILYVRLFACSLVLTTFVYPIWCYSIKCVSIFWAFRCSCVPTSIPLFSYIFVVMYRVSLAHHSCSNVLLLECTNTIDSTLHCVCGVAFRFIVYQHNIVAITTVYTTVRCSYRGRSQFSFEKKRVQSCYRCSHSHLLNARVESMDVLSDSRRANQIENSHSLHQMLRPMVMSAFT